MQHLSRHERTRTVAAVAAVAAAALLTTLAAPGCAASRVFVPSVDRVDPRVTGIDARGFDVAFDVGVKNPFAESIPTPRCEWALEVRGQRIAEGSDLRGSGVPGRRQATLSLPMRVEFQDLARTLHGLDGVSEFDYAIAGAIILPVAGRTYRVPFERAGKLPVVHPPVVTLRSVDTSGLTDSGGTILVDADVMNPNGFEMGLDGVRWTLDLGGASVGGLTASSGGQVGAGAHSMLRIETAVADTAAITRLRETRGRGLTSRLLASGEVDTQFGRLPLK